MLKFKQAIMPRIPFFANCSDNSPKQTGYKLYGLHFSTSTWRVLAALHEKNLGFEFIPIELKDGEHKRQPYLSVNPFGQIPALTDGDLKLFESRAIVQYISYDHSRRGTQLFSASHKSMAILTVWMEVEAHQFDPVATKLTFEQVIKPIFGMPTDPEVVKENEEKLAKVLDVYETRLQHSKYLASDSFTLADLYHLPNVHALLGTPTRMLFEMRPFVHKWVIDITGRPAWQKVIKGIH